MPFGSRAVVRGYATWITSAFIFGAAIAAACKRSPPVPGAAGPVARPPAAQANEAAPGAEGKPSPPAATPTVTVDVAGAPAVFHVEVARTPEEHANGLVGRPTLASDAGLLFVFDQLRPQSVSTRNTQFPTDLLFIGGDGRIGGIVENAMPGARVVHRVAAPARYVLQIRGGLSARFGLRAGQPVRLAAIPGA